MSPGLPHPSHTDRQELKEIIKEFVSRYKYLHEKRIHKLLFYSEIYTLQHHEQRISAADFKPYDYGPYAELIRDVLQELEQNNELDTDTTGNKTRYKSTTGGELSDEKIKLIKTIHAETRTMRTQQLVKFAKSTPLWQNHQYNETMDFDKYLATAVLETDTRKTLINADRTPADPNKIETLLS